MTNMRTRIPSMDGSGKMSSVIKRIYISLGHFRALYVLAALELLVYLVWSMYTGLGVHGHPDIKSYYKAYDMLISGQLDMHRTPFYPLLIGSLQVAVGDLWSKVIIYIIQIILFLFSIKWVGSVIGRITTNQKIAYWFTAIYALYPGILSYCVSITTESLAVSLISATLYCTCGAYFDRSRRKAAISGILCIVLVMHRPSLIVVPVALSIFWGALLLFKRRIFKVTALYGLASLFLSFSGVGIYAFAYKQTYHITSISSISTINHYVSLRIAGLIDADIMEPSLIKTDVDSIVRVFGKSPGYLPWAETGHFENIYGPAEFHRFVVAQIKASPKEILKYLFRWRLTNMMDDKCISAGFTLPPIADVIAMMAPNNYTAITIFLIGFLILLRNDISRRKISYFKWLLMMWFIANYLEIWIGAPDDFSRLLAQNYVLLLSVTSWVFDRLFISASDGNYLKAS